MAKNTNLEDKTKEFLLNLGRLNQAQNTIQERLLYDIGLKYLKYTPKERAEVKLYDLVENLRVYNRIVMGYIKEYQKTIKNLREDNYEDRS